MMSFAQGNAPGTLKDGLRSNRVLDVAIVATDCEVEALRNEIHDQIEKSVRVVGVFDDLKVDNDLRDADDFLSEEQPFYNHFNGSDKFDEEISVQSPPENGDKWVTTEEPSDNGTEEIPRYNSLDNFEEFLENEDLDFLIFSEAHNYSEEIHEFLQNKQEDGLKVLPFAEFFRAISHKEPVVSFSEHSFLYDFEFPESSFTQKWWRRLTDIGVSLAGAALLMPIWLVIAAAIKLTSKGPIVYRQTRVGKDGEEFTLYKFRTMCEDAECDGPQWASEEDDRVTRLGTFLRKTKLDETLQFFNVLKGDMRLIGPRPERPEFVETLREKVPFYDHRHRVHPGLTGWAQIHYGYGSSVEDAMVKLQYDLYGIKHRSIPNDLKILWNTFLVVTGLKETKKTETDDPT